MTSPHDPEPDVGAVFQPEVEQAEHDARELQRESFQSIRSELYGHVGQHVERRLGK